VDRLVVDGAAELTPLAILGVTGSIGAQALEVADRLGRPVVAIAASRGSEELIAASLRHPEASVAVAEPTDTEREAVGAKLGSRASFGPDAVAEAASTPGTIVVNGIVGAAGLRPSVAALRAGNRLALANKESLVAGGPVVMQALHDGGGELIPVDSEHSALWQCLVGEDPADVRRLILTASGGPFRGMSRDELARVGVEEALAHPTWSMGRRITIDSATLMNKAFEVIEAHYLFGVTYDRIDVIVHPESIVHSLVEFMDGSVKAELGEPDMRVPIQYAITYPERAPATVEPFDLTLRPLHFEAPDRDTFPCLDLGFAAGRRGGIAPAVLNAADEVAVAAFLDGVMPFPAIAKVVAHVLEATPDSPATSVDTVLEADAAARALARDLIAAQ
jgi:1-deoxy-D-xylulose-5-phosphate reductoisomerase